MSRKYRGTGYFVKSEVFYPAAREPEARDPVLTVSDKEEDADRIVELIRRCRIGGKGDVSETSLMHH